MTLLRSHRFLYGLALTVVLLLALLTRLSSWREARVDGQWVAGDGDTYYHLRRIEQTIERRGRVPMFDPDLAYPDGQRIQWHGGYDLLIAGVVVTACGTSPSRPCLETAAMFSTPVLGVLTTLFVLLLGRAVAGRWTGMLAAGLFAVYPFSAGAAALGHVDHHVLEPLLVAAWFLALARGRPVVAGVIAGLSFAVFPSALLPVAATLAALGLERLTQMLRAIPGTRDGFRFALSTTIVLLPVVWTGAFANVWEPSATSRLHLAVVGGLAAMLGLAEITVRWLPSRRLLVRGLILGALIAVIGAVAVSLALPRLSSLLRLSQSAGLWSGNVQLVALGGGPLALGVLWALTAAACVVTAVRAARGQHYQLWRVAVVALPLTAIGIWQIRFLMMASALLVIVVAYVLIRCGRALSAGLVNQPLRTRILGHSLAGALVALAMVPLREYLHDGAAPNRLKDGEQVLRRLGSSRHTRRSAVLSNWLWGHHTLYRAGLPTVASPFIFSGHDEANVLALRALLVEQAERLYAFMDARRARYLLAERGGAESMAMALGIRAPPARPAATALMATQGHGWHRLRMIDAAGAVRLFELVPGARIVGRTARAGEPVTATVVLGVGRETVVWRYETRSDRERQFHLRVPYATDGPRGRVHLVGDYRLGACKISVPERAVMQGGDVDAPDGC